MTVHTCCLKEPPEHARVMVSDKPTCKLITIGSACGIITAADVEHVVRSYVDEHSCSNPISCPPMISIDPSDRYINCISSGQDRGSYTHTTVTVRYERSNLNGIAYLVTSDANYHCVGTSVNTRLFPLESMQRYPDCVARMPDKPSSGSRDKNIC